jgi:hypothetical protein
MGTRNKGFNSFIIIVGTCILNVAVPSPGRVGRGLKDHITPSCCFQGKNRTCPTLLADIGIKTN